MAPDEHEVLGCDLSTVPEGGQRCDDVLAIVLAHVAHDVGIGSRRVGRDLGEDGDRGRVDELVGVSLEPGQDVGEDPLAGGLAGSSVRGDSGHASPPPRIVCRSQRAPHMPLHMRESASVPAAPRSIWLLNTTGDRAFR
jgi:hypothetical protein